MKFWAVAGAAFLLVIASSYSFYDNVFRKAELQEAAPAIVEENTASPDIQQSAAVLVENRHKLSQISEPRTQSNQIIVKSRQWDNIEFGALKLINNVWGAPLEEKLTSYVYLNPNGSFGWFWDRNQPKIKTGNFNVQPLYPLVKLGGRPWEASNTRHFPVRLADIKSLSFDTEYKYPQMPEGSYNLAYDVFIMDTNQPSSKPVIKAELMIWLHATASQLAFTYKGDFSDGVNTYGLYSWVMKDGRLYYSFVMKGEPQQAGNHVVNARKLLDKLELDPGLYIHGVELGNEVFNGSGKIEIDKFNVNLNGNNL